MGRLIQPTALLPWSVEIVSAVPVSLVKPDNGNGDEPKKKKKKPTTSLDSSQVNAGFVCPGWACLASPRGSIYVWSVTSSSKSVSPTKQSQQTYNKPIIDAPRSAVPLYHPSLAITDANQPPPLVSMTPTTSGDAVFVYAAQPIMGMLFVWKVTQHDVRNALTMVSQNPIAHAQLPLYDDDDEEGPNEIVTSMIALENLMVVLGTSRGGLICVSQSKIPVSLHAQRLIPGDGKSRKSLIGILWGNGSDVKDCSKDDSACLFQVPLSSDNKTEEILAISMQGSLVHWKITPTSGHRVLTVSKQMPPLVELFLENVQTSEGIRYLDPLQVKRSGNRLHFLVRATFESGDSRLYWVRLRVTETDHGKLQLHWVDAQWLNRFPAPHDVTAMGLVLTDDSMAYAAFHLKSGGVTSSVIVMAMSDTLEDDESTRMQTNEAEGDESFGSIIYEIDLPVTEVPALLPDTFANDVVTFGCCVYSQSGLGIRVRAMPPVSAAPLSPRAAAQANPSAVLRLTTHVRSAFWQAYQHQDRFDGAMALPPSIVGAALVNLEEAIISVATQLHVQQTNSGSDRGSWSLASTTVSSNGLEWHLAFIQWLRQGGLYRKLSIYSKWRLFSLGQEVAAYLELIAPSLAAATSEWEQEQFAKLTLEEGLAPWLSDRLTLVLQEGNMEQYQLWCGWFSTALATAITYREERASDPYDIDPLDHPPRMGYIGDEDDPSTATPRVPVWTSHPVLQKIFGLLLQHWKIQPKQKSIHALPPKTVEVLIKGALTSFADSASCLDSVRAIGKYAEIKAMTIPLLRSLQPLSRSQASQPPTPFPNDGMAWDLSVRHEYYEGICQIAHDHDFISSENFRLEPLLQSATECQSKDFQTDFTFPQFVLHWQAEKGKYGHAIAYGRLCPERDLNTLLKNDERFRRYRWIQSVHKGDYNSAAASLLEQSEQRTTVTLPEAKWALCMAKLTNQVVLKESQSQREEAKQREFLIENSLELVGVQKELMEDSSGTEQHLESRGRLLELAFAKLDQVNSSSSDSTMSPKESASRFCYLALLVCVTFENEQERRRNAVKVWAKALEFDWENLWAEWIGTEEDLSSSSLAELIIDSTVFGDLLGECSEEKTLAPVSYIDEGIEMEVIDELGRVRGTGIASLRRLLSNVTTTFQNNVEVDQVMEDAMVEGALLAA